MADGEESFAEAFDSYRPMENPLEDVIIDALKCSFKEYSIKIDKRENKIIAKEAVAAEGAAGEAELVRGVLSPLSFFVSKQLKATCELIWLLISTNASYYPEVIFPPEVAVTKCPITKKETCPLIVKALEAFLVKHYSHVNERSEEAAINKLKEMCSPQSRNPVGRNIALKKVKYDKDAREKAMKEPKVSFSRALLAAAGTDPQKSIDLMSTLLIDPKVKFPLNIEEDEDMDEDTDDDDG